MSHPPPKTCEKKLKQAEAKVQKILSKMEVVKLNNSYISRLGVPKPRRTIKSVNKYKLNVVYAFGAVLLFLGGSWVYREWPSSKSCILKVPSSTSALFRPPEDCSMCAHVTGVTRLSNTSAAEFELRAYSAEPVIVTDATADWKAVQEFNFNFFATFYRDGKLGKQVNDCFFFAYKSGLHSLREVFAMEESRANLSGAPWYVGWSTCYDDETRRLREYYDRPYFLPNTAESDMARSSGCSFQVDSVRHVSWQAQIRGRKLWQLAPPPECLYYCKWITFTVSPGEILVVDTNRWYHQTTVLPGDISITIGAEYD
ncbi:Uncharacterized protein OBRU01_13637 [Operophtera brumata]|uniref:Uncharacterized protein n=1 Tax=Operophtera brumata TaxID=104452 RepID=A0A0L7L7M6_OPEBR|nr:Uncharacterized protein OBRU01_13637 [Operophtera brumata]